MTPERIAEFRDAIANHPHFGIGGDALSKILDALEAAQAEIAVDAGRLRDAAMRVWGEDAHGCDTPDRLADAILGLRAQIADLKRGGVVSARDLDGLWQIVEREREWRLQDSECGGDEIRESVGRLRREWDEATSSIRTIPADRVLREGDRVVGHEEWMYLAALERYARKHGPESIQDVIECLDHLRANQGGANHV